MSNQRARRFLGLSLTAFLLLLPLIVPTAGAQTEEEEAEEPSCEPVKEFNAADFPSSANIDHPWLPLIPGNQLVLQGVADRGGGLLPHRVVFTATGLTKVIAGVPTRVMWDLDINEGRLDEAELAFFAQDLEGNVWNIGEYPEEYEEETFIGAPSTWIHGAYAAEGGVHMLAAPTVSDVEYLQGSVEEIEFLDCARVVSMAERSCVPVRCYEPVLLTHERSPLDPEGGIQTKFHSQGVGIVQVGAIDDPEGETLVLVEHRKLSPEALDLANREALRLEKRAYRVSPAYWGSQRIVPPRGPETFRSSRGAQYLRASRWPEARPAPAARWRDDPLKGGKARWCVRALGRRLCKRWANTGSVLPY
jgi:hypothetical protein